MTTFPLPVAAADLPSREFAAGCLFDDLVDATRRGADPGLDLNVQLIYSGQERALVSALFLITGQPHDAIREAAAAAVTEVDRTAHTGIRSAQ